MVRQYASKTENLCEKNGDCLLTNQIIQDLFLYQLDHFRSKGSFSVKYFLNYTLFISREGAIDRLVGIYKRVIPRCGVWMFDILLLKTVLL